MNELIPIESRELIVSAEKAAQEIKEVICTDEVEYTELCGVTKALRETRDILEDERKAVGKPYYDKYKQVNEVFKPVQNAVDIAYTKCNAGCGDWEKKKDEIVRKQQQELMRKAEEERQKKLAEAKTLQAKGDAEKAARVTQAANLVVAPIIETPKKVKGRTTRISWVGEIQDRDKFVKYCIDNNRLEFLMPDERAWNTHADVIKKPFMIFGTCRIYKKEVRY